MRLVDSLFIILSVCFTQREIVDAFEIARPYSDIKLVERTLRCSSTQPSAQLFVFIKVNE